MSEITVTLSANAGISLCLGTHNLWVDALHSQKIPGFSAVDALMQENILKNNALGTPEWIVHTHSHPDHYSEALTRAAAGVYPQARLLLPKNGADPCTAFRQDDLELTFLRLPHEGEQYRDTVHYGLMITWQGRKILLPGDCQIASSALAEAVENTKIDLAFLNFPWLTLKKGRDFLREALHPKQCVLYHLPFEKDDTNGYRRSARLAAREADNVRILDEPFQMLRLEI